MIYGCGLPLNFVESTLVKDLFAELRPSYVLPSRSQVSGSLLDKTCEELQTEQSLGGMASLLVDGWKNSSANTKTVATFIHRAAKDPREVKLVFLKSYDFSVRREDGEALCEVVDDSRALAKTQYNTEVVAVVTDNASNMKKMGGLTPVWHSTCFAHSADLLMKDICKQWQPTMTRALTVVKEFRTPAAISAIRSLHGTRLVLPCETRWGSKYRAVKSILTNLTVLKSICADPDRNRVEISSDIQKLLFDEGFIGRLQELASALEPLCQFTDRVQKDGTSVAEAVELWLEIELPEKVRPLFVARSAKAISAASLVANVLHPLYRGRRLDQEQLSIVDTCMLELTWTDSDAALLAYRQYMEGAGRFGEVASKTTSPEQFWYFCRGLSLDLSALGRQMAVIPASSAAIERLFSVWGSIHTPKRNRLTPQRSEKLTYARHSLRQLDKKFSPADYPSDDQWESVDIDSDDAEY